MNAKQIEAKFRGSSGRFAGVFALDTFPMDLKPDRGAILNLDNSSGPGSHWVGIFKSVVLEYFDPLGLPPPSSFNWRGAILYNKRHIQSIDSVACGPFAVDFVKRRIKGEDFTSIQQSYSNNAIFNDLLQ